MLTNAKLCIWDLIISKLNMICIMYSWNVSQRKKDLGVIISGDLKWEKQCTEAVNKANRMLGMIKCNFIHRSKETIILLYKSLVRLTWNIVARYGVLTTRRI